jgi:5-methylthioadenosine/S-adenosylhomocysteine deaminase
MADRKSRADAGSKPRACDLLIAHGHVLSMDAKRTVFPDGAIAIEGARIVGIGPTRDIAARFNANRSIDARGGAVHPGFIDGHTHASLHLTRGCITDNPKPAGNKKGPGAYARWFNALTDEDEHISALMASVEMVRNGFTGFVEAATAFEPDAVAAAAEAVGIRASVTDPMIWDLAGGEPMTAELPRAPCNAKRARQIMGQQLKRNKNTDGLVRGHVGLYGMGSASDELTLAAKKLADQNGAVFHQHQSMMQGDVDFDVKRFKKRPLVHFAELGVLGPNAVFTHMNVLDDADLEAVKDSNMAIVWQPGNFMFYSISKQTKNRMPELHRAGIALGFGADVAKVWTYGELGFIAYLVTREGGDYLPSESIFEMFTLGGARTIGMADEIGSLEVGKRADIVIRTNDFPDAQPNTNVVRQLTLVNRTKGIDTVLVNGEIVVRNGRLTRLDEGEVYAKAQASARRMAKRADVALESAWPTVV